jgi:hypothetical protein
VPGKRNAGCMLRLQSRVSPLACSTKNDLISQEKWMRNERNFERLFERTFESN